MRYIALFFFCTCLIYSLKSQDKAKELGSVTWLRDYETALDKSKQEQKDILILFQEVPGCATCQNYGTQVLSHPLLVEALENEFIPLAIFNNHKGKDATILQKYNEPSWNNPVVRLVDQEGNNVQERLNGNYSALGLAAYLVAGLEKQNKAIPKYLSLTLEALAAKANRQETKYYQMYCFWSGEGNLANHEGVVATSPGFMNGAEVVKVVYDPTVLDQSALDKTARKASCQVVDKPGKFRLDRDEQYYLKKSPYSKLALTKIQRSKINSAIYNREDPSIFLSPKQKAHLIKAEEATEQLYDLPFKEAWQKMLKT